MIVIFWLTTTTTTTTAITTTTTISTAAITAATKTNDAFLADDWIYLEFTWIVVLTFCFSVLFNWFKKSFIFQVELHYTRHVIRGSLRPLVSWSVLVAVYRLTTSSAGLRSSRLQDWKRPQLLIFCSKLMDHLIRKNFSVGD